LKVSSAARESLSNLLQVLERFEQVWLADGAPDIRAFWRLARNGRLLATRHRRQLLEEVVKIDLDTVGILRRRK